MAAALAELPLPQVLRYPLATPVGRYRAVAQDGARVRLGDVIALRGDGSHGGPAEPLELLRAAAAGRVEATPTALLLHAEADAGAARRVTAPGLVERVQEAGIVGLGGAGYPTHLKLSQAREHGVGTLIVNAVECEAGVNADRALLRCHAEDVLAGIEVVAECLGGPRVILAVGAPLDFELGVPVAVAPGPYPAGWERALIQRLLGVQAPPDGYPTDVGALVLNVATVFAIARAWRQGEPLTRRVVTVGARECWVRVGHPVAALPLPPGAHTVGGPVTGWLAEADAAVTKTTRAVTPRRAAAESPCIRCGWCASACPRGLLPQELLRGIEAGNWRQTGRLRVDDCIECGACDVACPSHLPLLAAIRHAKGERLEAARRSAAASLARTRFEARNARMERGAAATRARLAARLRAPRDWLRPAGSEQQQPGDADGGGDGPPGADAPP